MGRRCFLGPERSTTPCTDRSESHRAPPECRHRYALDGGASGRTRQRPRRRQVCRGTRRGPVTFGGERIVRRWRFVGALEHRIATGEVGELLSATADAPDPIDPGRRDSGRSERAP